MAGAFGGLGQQLVDCPDPWFLDRLCRDHLCVERLVDLEFRDLEEWRKCLPDTGGAGRAPSLFDLKEDLDHLEIVT